MARWRGSLDLAGNDLDCYVLEDGTRVLSSGSATKAIAEIDRGSLQDYAGQKALNPFINIEKILQETIRFQIPGTQWPGMGITTEHFELICRGYVQALYEGAQLTDRQREIAIRCAVCDAFGPLWRAYAPSMFHVSALRAPAVIAMRHTAAPK